jgi:hypothetical protein
MGAMSHSNAAPATRPRRRRWALVAVGVVVLLAAVALLGSRRGGGDGGEVAGGPDFPLALVAGEAFEVAGFDYAAGWTLGADPDSGAVQLTGLRLTNDRDGAERLAATVRLVDGNIVVASLFCKAGDGYDYVPVGVTVNVLCESSDPMPAAYDRVTIRDTY